MKLLLHACCGPCTIEPARILRSEGHEITVAFVNPNIQPVPEYYKRYQELQKFCLHDGFEVVEFAFEPDEWERKAAVCGTDREKRCRQCYRMRFKEVAAYAREHGFEGISTTLSVSPYQQIPVILQELERAAAHEGLKHIARDFTAYYQQSTVDSREMGLYRQDYCGCRFSAAEAASERGERREARHVANAQKRACKRVAQLTTTQPAAGQAPEATPSRIRTTKE